jgi:RNA polymerase sigma factor (sigma-70 family)
VGDTTHDLYRRYGKQIYSYCHQRLRSREEAEDAVQTTFMNAFRSLQRGATAEYEQAWLFKIAQNVCIARHSSSARRLSLEAPNDFEVLQEVVPARDGEEPLELIGIEEALERMPENQRRAILLREWQGLSYREICEELDLSQAAVEMLIFRARRTLAGALEQPQESKKRIGRKVGSLGSILGALKTLFGGGAAIKAAAVAAAAVAVVGESASHTIVRQTSQPRSTRRVPAAAAPAVRAVESQSPSHAVAAGRNAGVALAPKHVPSTHVVAPSVVSEPAPHVTRAPRIAEPAVAAAPPVAAATTTTASVPAPAAAPPAPAPAAPTPAPAPAPATAVPAPAPVPVQTPPTTTTPTTTITATTTTTTPTATTTTTSTPVAPTPAPSVDPQPDHGNDGDHGHGRQKDAPPPVDVTAPVVAQPAPVQTTGNGKGNGLALGRNKNEP